MNKINLNQLSPQQLLMFVIVSSILFCALYFPLLDFTPLINEETRRALVAKELLERNEYLVTTIGGDVYTAKPPLFNWLIIMASAFNEFTITEFSARLPSVIATALLVIYLIKLTANWWSMNTTLLLFVALAFTPQMLRKGTLAEIDMVFTLFVTLSLFSWFTFYQKQHYGKAWLYSAIFIGLAYLCKREAALLFYVLSLYGYLIWRGKTKLIWHKANFLALLIIVAAVALWIVPIISTYSVEVFFQQTNAQIAARSAGSGWGEYIYSSAIYPIEVMTALFPTALMLPFCLSRRVRSSLITTYGDKFYFCLFILLINIIPYILLGDSNVRYFLPMFPVAFILACMVFSQLEAFSEKIRLLRWMVFYFPMILMFLLLVGLTFVWFTVSLDSIASVVIPLIWVVIVLYMVRYRILSKGQQKHYLQMFLEFCVIFCLVIRLFELSYNIPRVKAYTEANRNIEQILISAKQASDELDKTIIALPDFSHAIYFYDNNKVVTPFNCQMPITDNHLMMTIVKNKHLKDHQYKASFGNIVWQMKYRSKQTIFLHPPREEDISHCR